MTSEEQRAEVVFDRRRLADLLWRAAEFVNTHEHITEEGQRALDGLKRDLWLAAAQQRRELEREGPSR